MSRLPDPSSRELKRWLTAIFLLFMLLGNGWGALLTRFPTLRDELDYSLSMMSLIVLFPSAGTIAGLTISGWLESRIGTRRMLTYGMAVMAVALPAGSSLLLARHETWAFASLTLFGAGFGIADVAINLSGSRAEQASRRPRLSMLHAGFSIGGIVSVLAGALAEATQFDVVTHHIIVSVAILLGALLLRWWIIEPSRTLVPDTTGPITLDKVSKVGSVWRDPRVLLLGFIALAGSLADGVATDWMPLAFIDVYALQSQNAVLVLVLLYVGTLVFRLTGDRIVSRVGRVRALRMPVGFAGVGILLVALSPWPWLAIPGALLWGAGDALALPLSVSAAADNPKLAPRRVSAVTTIAYSAYVAGPVGFGLLSDYLGFRVAFVVLAVIVALAWAASSRAESPRTS